MRTVAIVTLSLLAVSAQAGEVYRSIDAQGNVVYSDRPASEDSTKVAIRTSPPPRAARAPSTREAPSGEPAADVPDQATVEAAERAQLAEDRAANCTIATERNVRYSTSRRLYREGSDGERVYLNDAELTEARNNAQAEVSRWCE